MGRSLMMDDRGGGWMSSLIRGEQRSERSDNSMHVHRLHQPGPFGNKCLPRWITSDEESIAMSSFFDIRTLSPRNAILFPAQHSRRVKQTAGLFESALRSTFRHNKTIEICHIY